MGLVNALQRVSWTDLVNIFTRYLISKGAISEQFVPQHLFYMNSGSLEPELFYWLRNKKRQNAEVDFIIPIDHNLVPLEVKSFGSGF